MESKNIKTINFRDMIIKCCDCDHDFCFSIGEQKYFSSKGLSTPRRCVECRLKRRLSLVQEVRNGS